MHASAASLTHRGVHARSAPAGLEMSLAGRPGDGTDDQPSKEASASLAIVGGTNSKDMPGVMKGFVDHIDELPEGDPPDAGRPGGQRLSRTSPRRRWNWPRASPRGGRCPEEKRRRVHWRRLPMDDIDENAAMVNALQHLTRARYQEQRGQHIHDRHLGSARRARALAGGVVSTHGRQHSGRNDIRRARPDSRSGP